MSWVHPSIFSSKNQQNPPKEEKGKSCLAFSYIKKDSLFKNRAVFLHQFWVKSAPKYYGFFTGKLTSRLYPTYTRKAIKRKFGRWCFIEKTLLCIQWWGSGLALWSSLILFHWLSDMLGCCLRMEGFISGKWSFQDEMQWSMLMMTTNAKTRLERKIQAERIWKSNSPSGSSGTCHFFLSLFVDGLPFPGRQPVPGR